MLKKLISVLLKIRSAGQKIEKSSGALDGHGDEGSGNNVLRLDQDVAYSSLTGDPKPFCDTINHKILTDIITTKISMHEVFGLTQY